MKDVNLSFSQLVKQVGNLMQQYLRVSEDLELAHERITVLENKLQVHDSMSQKRKIYGMKILQAKNKGA